MDEYKPLILKQKWDIRSAKARDSDYITLIKEDLQATWDVLNTAVGMAVIMMLLFNVYVHVHVHTHYYYLDNNTIDDRRSLNSALCIQILACANGLRTGRTPRLLHRCQEVLTGRP